MYITTMFLVQIHPFANTNCTSLPFKLVLGSESSFPPPPHLQAVATADGPTHWCRFLSRIAFLTQLFQGFVSHAIPGIFYVIGTRVNHCIKKQSFSSLILWSLFWKGEGFKKNTWQVIGWMKKMVIIIYHRVTSQINDPWGEKRKKQLWCEEL